MTGESTTHWIECQRRFLQDLEAGFHSQESEICEIGVDVRAITQSSRGGPTGAAGTFAAARALFLGGIVRD